MVETWFVVFYDELDNVDMIPSTVYIYIYFWSI